MGRTGWRYLVFAVLVAPVGIIRAQPTTGDPQASSAVRDPLAAKQEIVRDRMLQLEDRLFRLADKLAETEPQQAEQLRKALRQARELLIRQRMDEAIAMLEAGQFTDAGDEQTQVNKALEQVLKLLLEEAGRRDELARELERLKEFRKNVEQLIERQRELKEKAVPNEQAGQTQPAPGEPAKESGQQTEGDLHSEELERQQRELQQDTGKLARQMQSGESSESPEGDTDGSQSQPAEDGEQQTDPRENAQSQPAEKPEESTQASEAMPAPGSSNIEQAQQHMGEAAQQLQQQQVGEASQEQQKAIEELEQARRELEEALDQLRREQQEEMLRGLEVRFRSMLARQLVINDSTSKLDAKGQPNWTHGDELALASLAQDQSSVAGEADETVRVLEEEGTTIVFPRIVEQLADDMRAVADRLQDKETGELTQQMEAAIIATLEELIEAVKELRRKLDEGQMPQAEGALPDSQPLLPDSAELKMLRSCQTRVNRQTAQIEAARPENVVTEQGQASEQGRRWQREVNRVADRQRDIADLARKLNERATGE